MGKEIISNFKWVSARQYAIVTGMPYQQVLTLCKEERIESYTTEGGCYWVKLNTNSDVVPRAEYNELLEKYTKVSTKLESIENILGIKA